MVLFLFFLLFACCSIAFYKKEKINALVYLLCTCLFALAFFQEVDSLSDLNEAFYQLDQIRKEGFSYFEKSNVLMSMYFYGRYALQIYFYILSFFPCNNFYSAISILLIYYLSFANILKYYNAGLVDIRYTKMMLLVLLFLVDFYDGANGVRNMLSFSIFIYAVVRDLCFSRGKKEKFFCIMLYAVSVFLHSSAWALLVIRVLLCLKKQYVIILCGVLFLFVSLFVPNVYDAFGAYKDVPVMGALLHGLDSYAISDAGSMNYDKSAFNMQSSYIMMSFFRKILLVLLIYQIYKVKRFARELPPILMFSLLLCLFALGTGFSSFATNVLTRYSYAVIFLTPIIFLEINILKKKLLSEDESFEVKDRKFEQMLICVIILFSYYMFRYHYSYMHFAFRLY